MRICPALSLLLFAAVCTPLVAQCRDPRPPRGGFPVTGQPDLTVTYSDSYRTKANVLYPNARPGTCGWPLVVFVHGLGGSRADTGVEGFRLASLGYFVLSYDVRGQGAGITLNPGRGSKLWSLDEWIDLAEVVRWAAGRFSDIDRNRVAVYGDSQGGLHAWAAAAYSGRMLPNNPRWKQPYPVFRCVVPRFIAPSLLNLLTRNIELFHWHLPGVAFDASSSTLVLDAAYQSQIQRFLDNDDPAGLYVYMRTFPGKDFMPPLFQTRVPVLTVQGWQDPWTHTNAVLDLLRVMRAETPRRLFMTTGQHGMPPNKRQEAHTIAMTELWLRRYLKQGSEPIERGPRYLMASLPGDATEYGDPDSLWRTRAEGVWPPPVATQRLYLRSSQRLLATAPSTAEPHDTITQTVRNGFDARGYHAAGGQVAAVERSIPRSEVRYDGTPLVTMTELAGTPVVSLLTEPRDPVTAISARLYSVSPQGTPRLLTAGARALRRTTTPGKTRVNLVLATVSAVVPAGYRLRLVLSNLHVVEPFTTPSFGLLPVFSPFEVRVHHAPTELSYLDLPKRTRPTPDLATAATSIDVNDPGAQTFRMRASPAWRDSIYVVFLSLTGQDSQMLPGGQHLWLAPDEATVNFTQALNRPILANMVGLLDRQGSATGTLNFGLVRPLPSFLIGGSLHVSSVLYTQQGEWATGGPVRLLFR